MRPQPRMRNYHIKAYESQVKLWKSCAKLLGMSVSEWVRETLNSVVMKSVRPSFGEPEMTRGRKTSDEELAESFQFRITPWEKSEWTQCADGEGLAIGEWCRQCLDYMAESQFMMDLRKVV